MIINTHLGRMDVLKEDVLSLSDFVISFKDDGMDYRLELKDRTGLFAHHVYAISKEDAEKISREYGTRILRERAAVELEIADAGEADRQEEAKTLTVVKKIEVKDEPVEKKGLLNWM